MRQELQTQVSRCCLIQMEKPRATFREITQRIMAIVERFRHNVAAIFLWCLFLLLYLGGAFLLAIGLVFAARTWWTLIHQHAGLWALAAKTTELFAMAAGFLLILVIPLLQRRSARQRVSWRSERRSEFKSGAPAAD